ncbi:MAG: hypothetical protein D6681_14795 [Calditrichaeota bacterium]|nr:MAG: hypothetical protein D6681_14795 [Calditrichota bacterium]
MKLPVDDMPSKLPPSPSPTPEDTPIVTLPPIQGSIDEYRLRFAPPKDVLKILTQALYEGNSPVDSQIFGFEFKRSYEPEQFFAGPLDEEFYWRDIFPYTPVLSGFGEDIELDIMSNYLVAYLNDKHVTLHPLHEHFYIPGIWDIQVFEAGTTQDNLPRWLVGTCFDVSIPGGLDRCFWVTLGQRQDGTYFQTSQPLLDFWGGQDIENPEYQIRDVNGDGITDFVINQFIGGLGMHAELYHVILGSHDEMHVIESSARGEDNGGQLLTYWTEAQWSLSPDNHLPMLALTRFEDLKPWDCITSSKKTYQWIGEQERVTEYPVTYPDTAICKIAYAVTGDFTDRRERIRLLNAAYNHKDGLSGEYKAFVLYKLALLHALEGEDWAARQYIATLAQVAATGETPIAAYLTEAIQPLLAEPIVQPYKLCLAAESLQQLSDKTPGNPFTGFSIYPYTGFQAGYPGPLCNTRDILSDVLDTITPSGNPEDALRNAGIPTIFTVPFEHASHPATWVTAIPVDAAEEYFILGAPNNQAIFVYAYNPEIGWEILSQSNFFADIAFHTDDITGDGIPDVAVVAKSPHQNRCKGTLYASELLITQVKGKTLLYTNTYTICLPKDKTFDFDAFLADANQDGTVDWVMDVLAKNYDTTVILEPTEEALRTQLWFVTPEQVFSPSDPATLLSNLATQVLTSTTPWEYRDEILRDRERWAAGDSTDERNLHAGLDYLLALTYELEGNEEQAKALFFQIWQDESDTVWAYLAASRLEYQP